MTNTNMTFKEVADETIRQWKFFVPAFASFALLGYLLGYLITSIVLLIGTPLQ